MAFAKMRHRLDVRTNLEKDRAVLEDVRFSQNLTTFAIDYTQKADNFVHHRATTVIPVDRDVGRYKVLNRADRFRTEAGVRRPGSPARERTTGVTEATFTTVMRAVKAKLPREERNAGDSVIDDQMKIKEVVQDLLIRRELDWVTAYFNTGIWASNVVGVTNFVQWNGATPLIIQNMLAWGRLVQIASGYKPNVAVISPDVYDVAVTDATVLQRLSNSVSGTPSDPSMIRKWTLASLAAIFEVEEVLVPEGIRNTAAEGLAIANGFMAADAVLLAYMPKGISKDESSAGKCFSWSEFDNVSGDVARNGAPAIRSWYDDETNSDYFQGDMNYQYAVTDTACGLFASNVLA